jgi:hypothetical protein
MKLKANKWTKKKPRRTGGLLHPGLKKAQARANELSFFFPRGIQPVICPFLYIKKKLDTQPVFNLKHHIDLDKPINALKQPKNQPKNP